jgi:hypothetical protein
MLSVQPTSEGVRTSSRRVVRRSDGKSLSVFETPAADKGAFIADNGVWLVRYDPHEKIVRQKRSFLAADKASVERHARLILRNYRIRLEGDETVAGRVCHRLLLEPVHPRNLTVRIWVDRATGVELRRDEQDAVGNTISIVMYTTVAFPERIAASEVAPPVPRSARTVNISRSGLLTSVGSLSKAAGFTVRLPLALPGGYEFDRGTVVQIGGKRSGFLRFIDGISELTMVETRITSGISPGMRVARVIPRPYGETEVHYAIDDLQIVLVGRGDARELIAVAETLSKSRERAWREAMAREFRRHGPDVAAMRDRGLTAESVVALLTISRISGRSADALLDSHLDGWCWRDLARRWRVPESEIQRRLHLVVGGGGGPGAPPPPKKLGCTNDAPQSPPPPVAQPGGL